MFFDNDDPFGLNPFGQNSFDFNQNNDAELFSKAYLVWSNYHKLDGSCASDAEIIGYCAQYGIPFEKALVYKDACINLFPSHNED